MEKHPELCNPFHHINTKKTHAEPNLWVLDLEVKPEESYDTAALGVVPFM